MLPLSWYELPLEPDRGHEGERRAKPKWAWLKGGRDDNRHAKKQSLSSNSKFQSPIIAEGRQLSTIGPRHDICGRLKNVLMGVLGLAASQR
jgi:hypothetical protein